jgi:cytochrome P450
MTDDFTSMDVLDDPYTYFGNLRENDPLHWNPLTKSWIVTRYDDVLALIRNHDVFVSGLPPIDPRTTFPPIAEEDWEVVDQLASMRNFINTDRPKHLEMRQAVHRWFTPKTVERWRLELRATVHALVAAHEADGRMELKEDFATPLPLKTICLMLGVPAADAERLKDLAAAFAGAFAIVGVGFDPELIRGAVRAHEELTDYFAPLIDAREREPSDDLISLMADGRHRGVFTDLECIDNVILLLIAGHETTLNLITNGILAFLRNPEQWDLLRSNSVGLCASATEECLRYEPSIPMLVRMSTAEIELLGTLIPPGSLFHWITSSANRDPRRFANPEVFDITRSPNPHIAFGGGIHHCLGAALARIEAQEAFRGLAERFPRLELANDALEYMQSIEFRSLRALEVAWS